jgi:hypothetical protein
LPNIFPIFILISISTAEFYHAISSPLLVRSLAALGLRSGNADPGRHSLFPELLKHYPNMIACHQAKSIGGGVMRGKVR